MAKYLVTGGAGFIGSNITEELVKRGERVRVLDSFITGNRDNLKTFLNKIELIEGDIRDAAVVKDAMKGMDYVIHQAALRSVAKSVEDPIATNDTNVFGTLNILVVAKEAGIKRVVYASSSSAYGDAKSFPQKETDLPVPISPYGVSKLAAEHYCVTFAKTFGLETVSLRYFNVFGPRQNPESKYSAAIPAILAKMLGSESPIAEWDGKQSRDFTYVANVVEANLRACIVPKISGEVFNIACGSTTSILDIIRETNKILGLKLKPVYGPKRQGDVRKTYADISKMKNMLGVKKIVGFKEGLKSTIDWFKLKRLSQNGTVSKESVA
ncbi:MAG: SDR family oxidoreductase [Candidatus Omnitrophota bacterium]|nr:SDR family oxidoreductase [Candidatus Omnitrophota bacterium]